MPIDYTDPAQLLALLRPAYYAILAGQGPQTIDWPGPNGSTRRITYRDTNLDTLRGEIERLDAQIAKAAGGSPKRYAIRCG